MSTTYGLVRFTLTGHGLSAALTDRGWEVPELPGLADILDALAPPRGVAPDGGEPTAAALRRAAELLGGTSEPADGPGPAPGTIC